MKQTTNKLFPVLLVLIVLAFVLKDPARAGHAAGEIWAWCGHVGSAFGSFVDAL